MIDNLPPSLTLLKHTLLTIYVLKIRTPEILVG